MKKDRSTTLFSPDEHMGCFGNFNIEDAICRKFCILSLRCAVEYNHNSRMALIEELLSAEGLYEKIQ